MGKRHNLCYLYQVNPKVPKGCKEGIHYYGITHNHGTVFVQAQIKGVWQSSNAKYNYEDQTEVITNATI
jgi:hypothetical protein